MLALTACTGASGATFPSASKLPSAARKPDGIAVDLVSEPPPFRASSSTSDGVVTLRTPLGTTAALKLVHDFFEAVLREDIFALSQMLAPGAVVSDTRGAAQARFHSLTDMWRQRFAKYEYALLSGRVVYREAGVYLYHADDAASLPYQLKVAMTGDGLQPGDLILRVPIVNHTVKNERMLGTELTFWLRRDDSRYVIQRIAEEVPP